MSQQSHFLIALNGVRGFFATKTGGNPTTPMTRDYDGGASVPVVNSGRVTYDDLKIGRRFDVARDAAVIKSLRGRIGKAVTVTVQPTRYDYRPSGPKTVYNCVLAGVTSPDADANGTGVAKYDLTLAVKSVS